MVRYKAISEDFYNRNQSWCFAGVYVHADIQLRVEIVANAYEHQSHAKVSVWTQHGWMFHTSVPTGQWYDNMPSYTRKELPPESIDRFLALRDNLLTRFTAAWYNTDWVI